MILVLKYVQKVIKTYKTLVGALTHTCTHCTHPHYPQITPSPGKKMKPKHFTGHFLATFTGSIQLHCF